MFKYYNIKMIISIQIYILEIFLILKKNTYVYICIIYMYIIIIFLYFLELHKLKENKCSKIS